MLLKLMVVIVILACAGPFFIKGPDGQPLMTLDDLKPDITSPADLLPDALAPDPAPAEPTRVYKWQDENGVWQFSNNPADARGAEEVALDGHINTMEAFKPPPKQSAVKPSAPSSIPGVATVSSSQAAELMNTVTNLQETIDARKADLDATTGVKR
ncbi:MAG: hypothetical protein O2780_14750 [Proteobacteria bacterium]|nr:hypothetical protein [Pseudomonadota bacterium]MDA1301012.1 hypothetical protein [Pseudomonadota bacterium]